MIDKDPESLQLVLDDLEARMVQRRWTGIRGLSLVRLVRAMKREMLPARHVASIGDPLGHEAMRVSLRWNTLVGGQDWPAESRRMRQVGYLALEEGELLALRLPHRAISLLEFAEFCLDDADDCQGAFFAALTGAIAEVHAGKADEARSRREFVLRRYDELCARVPNLQSAEELVSQPIGLDDGGDDPWHGWKLRLVNYLRWCAGAPSSVDPPPTLKSEPELALEPAVGAPGTSVPSGLLQGSRRFTVMLSLLALLATFMLAAVLGGLVRHSSLLILTLPPAVAAMAWVIDRIARAVPFSVLPVNGFDVTISRSPLWPANRAAKARVVPWSRRWYVRGYFRFWRQTRPSSRWETLISPPKGDALDRLPSPLNLATRPNLAMRRTTSDRVFNPICLTVSPDLASLSWEWRLVGHLLADRGWDPQAAPPVWRVGPPGRRPVLRVLPPPLLTSVCSAQWLPFAHRAARSGVDLRPDGSLRSGGDEGPARAAVTIGFPVSTRAGCRLRLDDEPATGDSEPSPRPQLLLSPDRLVSRAPIAIVVARPGGENLGADQTTDRLRGFANETFLAGAYAVIAVPTLPHELTADALRLLTGEIADWDDVPGPHALHDLIDRVRNLVCGRPLTEREEGMTRAEWNRQRARVALDICLFGPH